MNDFIAALEAIDKKGSSFKGAEAVPYFKAYLDKASEMRKNELDSLKAEYLKRVSKNKAYADLLSTEDGWNKAFAAGSPASVLKVPGLPLENQLWNQMYLHI